MLSSKVKKVLVLAMAAAMVTALFAGCGKEEKKEEKKSGGTVVIAGSTSVQPLTEAIAEKYGKENGVKIQVQGGGSGQAIKSLDEKIAQIGALSREVKEEEKKSIKKEYVIAKDGVAVVVNKEVGVENLTLEQVKKIYTGEITNWKDVGGADAEIAVVSREEGSGTRGAFTEITGVSKDDKDMTTKKALVQPSTGSVIETVSTTPNSIGYVSLEAVNKKVKTVKVEGVEISADTVIKGTYKISRPFIYVVSKDVTAEAQSFIDFIMSADGQKLVKENGFIPVK